VVEGAFGGHGGVIVRQVGVVCWLLCCLLGGSVV
jgi:hypothetical protein